MALSCIVTRTGLVTRIINNLGQRAIFRQGQLDVCDR